MLRSLFPLILLLAISPAFGQQAREALRRLAQSPEEEPPPTRGVPVDRNSAPNPDPTNPAARNSAPTSSGPAARNASLPSLDLAALRAAVERLAAEDMEGRAPLSRGSERARGFLTAQLREHGALPAGQDGGFIQAVEKAVFRNTIGYNVVGVVKGRRLPEECVYVEAHYDHWGRSGGALQPGANDNASGVAVMLELARVVSRLGLDRSVVFLASDFEEGAAFPYAGGLKGAAFHAANPYCPVDKIKAALVMDMLGGRFVPGLGPRLFLLGSESSRQVHELVGSLASAQDSAVAVTRLGIYAIEPAGSSVPRADYGPFRELRVPFVFATSGIPPEYHTPEDTIEKLDFDFMARAGGELLGLLQRMASVDFVPAFADDPDSVTDWDSEAQAYQGVIAAVRGLRGLSGDQAAATLKIERDGRYLFDNLNRWSPTNRRTAIRRTVQNGVVDLMKMNGALRLWEHLARTHR